MVSTDVLCVAKLNAVFLLYCLVLLCCQYGECPYKECGARIVILSTVVLIGNIPNAIKLNMVFNCYAECQCAE